VADAKKNAARRRASIIFVDESGFSERPSVRRTWAPRGHTPILTHRCRSWTMLSAIGALGYRMDRGLVRVFLMLHLGAVHSREVVRFVRHLRRHLRGQVILIWDGLNAHKSRETQAYLDEQRHWLTVVRLPGYAPDLNPVEGMWGWIKGSQVANLCPDSLEPIRGKLRKARRTLSRRPNLVHGFLRRTGLSTPWV
jgi:transposase